MKSFSIGQKIVCVNDKHSIPSVMKCFKQWITVDTTYTVRGIRPTDAGGGILLEEINNPSCYFSEYGGNLEPAFHPTRFVPLQEIESVTEIMEYMTPDVL